MLLLLSGDIHPNPGPPKHPCGTCDTSVRSNQRRVVCDTCETWSHIKCVGIDRAAYERLSVSDKMWICIKYSLPFTHDPVIERQTLLQLKSSDILLSSRDTSCPTIGINTNSSSHSVPDLTTSTTSTSSTTTPSQTFDTECLWTEIQLPKTRPILIASVYRTPPKTDSSLDALERTFVLANETGNELIILGDMNLDLLPTKKGLVKKLTNLHRVLQFKQLVTKPTRVTEHSRTLIDHITTNRDNFITFTDVQSTGLSDHRMVYAVRKAT